MIYLKYSKEQRKEERKIVKEELKVVNYKEMKKENLTLLRELNKTKAEKIKLEKEVIELRHKIRSWGVIL